MSGYSALIIRSTKCEPEAAPLVEELMRVESPTLDGLDRRQFGRLARAAWAGAIELAKADFPLLLQLCDAHQIQVPPSLRTCDDCQSAPGDECHPDCSSNWK